MILFREMVGWFTPLDLKMKGPPCNCPVCGTPWTADDVGTITQKYKDEDPTLVPLLLFFRLHKTCEEKMSRDEKENLDTQLTLIGDRVSRSLSNKK
jgi:hypothetical protein